MTAARTRTRRPARCHAQLACVVTGPSSRKRPRTSIDRARTRFRDSELRSPTPHPPPSSVRSLEGAKERRDPVALGLADAVRQGARPRSPIFQQPPPPPGSSVQLFPGERERDEVSKYTEQAPRGVCDRGVSGGPRGASRALPHTQCDGRETCLTATCSGVQLNADTPSGTPWTTGTLHPTPDAKHPTTLNSVQVSRTGIQEVSPSLFSGCPQVGPQESSRGHHQR